MKLVRLNFNKFKPGIVYVCAYKVTKNISLSNDITYDSTYYAPKDKLKLLGHFIGVSLSVGLQIDYVFLNPYNNKKINVKMDFIFKNKRYNCFFGEYPLECIIAQQVPITSLLACQKNIPFDVMNIIQEFRIGEGNLKLQKLLEYCIRVSETNFTMKKLISIVPKENFMSNEPLKLPYQYPFEYYSCDKSLQELLSSLNNENLQEILSTLNNENLREILSSLNNENLREIFSSLNNAQKLSGNYFIKNDGINRLSIWW